MAFDIATEYTLPEVLRSKAPDGSHMVAIDVLSQPLPLMEEGYWVQANDETSHQFLRMTSEPVGSMVGYNEGAAFEAATTVPVTEQTTWTFRTTLRITGTSSAAGSIWDP